MCACCMLWQWVFWWELVEMLRRLALVGLFILIQRGSITQLVIGSTYCLIHLFMQMGVAPYKEKHDDFVANMCNFSMVVFFVCLLVFKVSTFAEQEEVQLVVTAEQRDNFRINSLALTCVLIGAVFSSAAMSVAVLYVQLRRAQLQLSMEARNAKARRLRYVEDDSEVLPPAITEPCYHLLYNDQCSNPEDQSNKTRGGTQLLIRSSVRFRAGSLSHCWGTGQDQMRIVKHRLLEMMPDIRVFLDVDDLVRRVLNMTGVQPAPLALRRAPSNRACRFSLHPAC